MKASDRAELKARLGERVSFDKTERLLCESQEAALPLTGRTYYLRSVKRHV